MKLNRLVWLSLAAVLGGCCGIEGVSRECIEADVVIYGSSPAALTAAIAARRAGRTAVIVSPETRIGGLTTGGLGQTDIGNKRAFGGLALAFYRDIAAYYLDDTHWTRQSRSEYIPEGQCSGSKGTDSMWTFEPSAALAVLEGWEKREGLVIHRGKWLDRSEGKVKVEGEGKGEGKGGGEGKQRRIVSFLTEDGTTYRGKMFVDATYEGDLMAAAGVSYVVGREANSVYGETISGIQHRMAQYHQFNPGIDPYVKKGDPKSGLLPGVEERNASEKDGDGDKRVQAYCFRMCLTDDPENRIPFAKPADYDELDYEILFRNFEAAGEEDRAAYESNAWAKKWWMQIVKFDRMPNRKTDSNNNTPVSTDFIGANWNWPEAGYGARRRMFEAHLNWQKGLMWTLANHPRVPKGVRDYVSQWGTCRDEFLDGPGDGWQSQLYVREARRLVGDYVMTEANCRGERVAARPVAMGAYTMDSHHVRRVVGADGFVHNEGDVQDYRKYSQWGEKASLLTGKRREDTFGPFPIDYGAIVPKRSECANLFVPVCLSASHMAFGSIRMEPVFFALGEVAGFAAAQAIDAGCAAQEIDYPTLRDKLLEAGQVIEVK